MDSTARTSIQTNLISPKCLQKSGLDGIHSSVDLFLRGLQKIWHLQLLGSFRIMAHFSTITCTMAGQILEGQVPVFLLLLAMTMMLH
nr:hypothetical protein Iba_scaffold19979CG0190 [Ipomoea batatas]